MSNSTPRSNRKHRRRRNQPTPPTQDSEDESSSSNEDRVPIVPPRAAKKEKPSITWVAILVVLIAIWYSAYLNLQSSKVTPNNKFTNLFSSDEFVVPAWLCGPLKLFPLTSTKCVVCKKELISEPRPSQFSQRPLKSTRTSKYQRTTKPYHVEPNTPHAKYLKALRDTGTKVSGPPYCQLLMPNNPHENQIMYDTQHMYQYGDQAGVYFCYPPREGPFKWRTGDNADNTYTHAGGKSGRCTNCESYYCKKFSCDIANSFLCNDCGDSSDSDGSDNEGAAEDDCCYEDPSDCYMIYKHDHSVKAKIQPLHELYRDAPSKYGFKIKDWMKLTDKEALELQKNLGGISLFHIFEVVMFNGIEDKNHPLYSDGLKVEGHDKSLILSGMETIIQLMITQDHAGRVNEHLHSNDIQDLVKQRDDIEKSHTEHIGTDLRLIFVRPSPDPKIPMPLSLREIIMHHGIDTSSWPAIADETDEGKDYANDIHKMFRPYTPSTYDMHYDTLHSQGKYWVNLYDRLRPYDGDYTFYSIKEHKKAYKRLLKNIDICRTTVKSKKPPQYNGVFCRYDENESVLFKALQKEGELKHLIDDYKGIKVPDDRMMTRLLIHRTDAKVYRTDGGLTYLCKYASIYILNCVSHYQIYFSHTHSFVNQSTQIRGMKNVKYLSVKSIHHRALLPSHMTLTILAGMWVDLL